MFIQIMVQQPQCVSNFYIEIIEKIVSKINFSKKNLATKFVTCVEPSSGINNFKLVQTLVFRYRWAHNGGGEFYIENVVFTTCIENIYYSNTDWPNNP